MLYLPKFNSYFQPFLDLLNLPESSSYIWPCFDLLYATVSGLVKFTRFFFCFIYQKFNSYFYRLMICWIHRNPVFISSRVLIYYMQPFLDLLNLPQSTFDILAVFSFVKSTGTIFQKTPAVIFSKNPGKLINPKKNFIFDLSEKRDPGSIYRLNPGHFWWDRKFSTFFDLFFWNSGQKQHFVRSFWLGLGNPNQNR